MVTPGRDVRRWARIRLLLAACTFALALGIGTALALPVVLEGRQDALALTAPGDTTVPLEPGRYVFTVSGSDLPLEDTRPICTALLLLPSGDRRPVPVVPESDTGFAAMRVPTAGDHQIACSSSVDGLTVTVSHATPAKAPRLLRAAALVLVLTALAVLLAARPLVVLRQTSP
jgi:hypothetical protein